MESMEYDLDKAITYPTFEVLANSLEVNNNTDLEQESGITQIVEYTNTQSWSNTLSNSINLETGVTVKIACVQLGSKVGIETTQSTTFSQSSTTSHKFQVTGSIKVPPYKKYKIDLKSVIGELEVPYRLKGILHFDKSNDCRGDHIRGVFKGKNAITSSAYYSEIYKDGSLSDSKKIENILVTKLS